MGGAEHMWLDPGRKKSVGLRGNKWETGALGTGPGENVKK